MTLELNDRLLQATLRIETCIPLFGAFCEDALSDALSDFLDEARDADLARLFPFEVDAGDREEFVSNLVQRKVMGYLVQVATPVMRPSAKGGSYSWGSYYLYWLYGDTMESLVEQAEVWAGQRRQAERDKATVTAAAGFPSPTTTTTP